MADFRTEYDSMGEVQVPADALWRAQTQRAVENFPISGSTLEDAHVQAIAHVKAAAAKVNAELGVVEQVLERPLDAGKDHGEVSLGEPYLLQPLRQPLHAPLCGREMEQRIEHSEHFRYPAE